MTIPDKIGIKKCKTCRHMERLNENDNCLPIMFEFIFQSDKEDLKYRLNNIIIEEVH